MMLSVIHSYPEWLPQTQTWMYNQIRYLSDDIVSHIVCETTRNLEQFRLPNIHALSEAPRVRFVWDKALRKLKLRRHLGFQVQIAREVQARILHSHFGNIGWADLPVARLAGLKHVVTFYGMDVQYLPQQEPVWLKRYQELFRSVDRILCEGPHMASCIARLGCDPAKITVQHLGVQLDEIPFQPRRWSPGEPLRILMAASFIEKKGIPYALEALGKLQGDVPLEMTLIGDARSEERSQKEKRLILETMSRLGLKVQMLGYQPHSRLFEESYRHHVFLSPSVTSADGDTEGGAPVSLIEMAATGMLIVSSRHADIPSVIVDGETGLLADERDSEGLYQHLKWLVTHPERWDGMLLAGRAHVEREYDAAVQGERLAALYRGLVSA